MRCSVIIGTVLACVAASTAVAQGSPTDPDAVDWVSISVSPQGAAGGFGRAGNRDQAIQIANDECAQRSNGARCVNAQTTEYGCVAYVLDDATRTWAGGRANDQQAALNDAISNLKADGVAFDPEHTMAGAKCSSPVTPP